MKELSYEPDHVIVHNGIKYIIRIVNVFIINVFSFFPYILNIVHISCYTIAFS